MPAFNQLPAPCSLFAFAACAAFAGCSEELAESGSSSHVAEHTESSSDARPTDENRGDQPIDDELLDHWYGGEQGREVRERRERIAREVETLSERDLPEDHWAHEWAGFYYVGDGLGTNITVAVAPQSGVSYSWFGCLGLYGANHGEVVKTIDVNENGQPDGLKVSWANEFDGNFDFVSEKMYFVRWPGPDHDSPDRRYLVPETQMLKVVNDFNKGGYARDGLYSAPLKFDHTDESRSSRASRTPVVGVPQLPPPWSEKLQLVTVDATVTDVMHVTAGNATGNLNIVRARITLDKGLADGLYVGLKARISEDADTPGVLIIEQLGEHAAVARYRAFTSPTRRATPPEVGDSVRLIAGAQNSPFD